MKNKLLLTLFIFWLITFNTFATHIVGGSLTYEQLGASTYRITLKVYRDCLSGQAPFDNPAIIDVRRGDGSSFTISLPLGTVTVLNPTIDSCVAKPNVCVEEGLYSTTVNSFPAFTGGYHLFWQRCCRNSSIDNIVVPLDAGESFYTYIPDNNLIISNSSPSWINSPPTFVCQGQPLNFNHGATDPDGDSLAYKFYTPYLGCDGTIDPLGPNCPVNYPTFPGNVATFNTVSWNPGYSASNPMGGAGLTLSSSGLLNGTPPSIGQFVMGIKCEEWRNGVKIGEIVRDFQFNVVNCPPLSVANFNTVGYCQGLSITFNNTTTPAASNYSWNFGDGATLADTSHAVNPTYTYPNIGTYIVTLIINSGTPCADTSIQTVSVPVILAEFTSNSPVCKNFAVNFTDISIISNSSSITNWNWSFGNGNTSTLQHPSTVYNTSGTYNATLIVTTVEGCKDTVVHPVTIQPQPIADAGADMNLCKNNPKDTLNGSINNASGGIWMGSGTFIPNNTSLNAIYTAGAAAIASGKDTLYLVTSGNGVCPADTDMVAITFYNGPTVNAGGPIAVCVDTASIHISASISSATGGQWTTSGTGVFANSNQINTVYFPSTADTAAGTITLYLSTTGNGNCLAARDSIAITFTPKPTISIISNDSICQQNTVPISANSSTGAGIWTSSGTGTFSTSNTVLNGYYNPSSADNTAGSVQLFFSSTNNGGCKEEHDTINITISAKPLANFSSVAQCAVKPVAFTNTSSILSGIITGWNWNFGDTTPIVTSQSPTHYFTSGGIYSVTLVVTSDAGCRDTVNNTITIYHKPEADFGAFGICKLDGTSFYDSSTVIGSNFTSWNWAFGDNTNSSLQNPIHNYPYSGNFTTTLIVQSAQGCLDTISQTLAIVNNPTANFIANPAIATVNQNVNFTDLSVGSPISWLWNFGDSKTDSISVIQNPVHFYSSGGYYQVCLTIVDSNSCADTLCHPEIVSVPPDIPTGFSPNGDGTNDIFYIYGGPFKSMNYSIYNNWGELIFTSTSQAIGWDGKRNGVEQPIGVYVYTATATTEQGETYTLSGDITLLR